MITNVTNFRWLENGHALVDVTYCWCIKKQVEIYRFHYIGIWRYADTGEMFPNQEMVDDAKWFYTSNSYEEIFK